MWRIAASAPGARAGGTCRSRSATRSDASSARRPGRPACTRTSPCRAVVLSCFRPAGARNRIVYVEANFPSVRYLSRRSRTRRGRADLDARLVEAIDERTLLVPISHVLFKNGRDPGRRADHAARARGRRARHARRVPVGGRRAVGRPALGVDFAVGGSVKWLCGGPGAGWLYVRPDLIERLEPTLVGWQGHARPFAFEPELEYADGSRRFLTGRRTCPRCTPRPPATT